MSSIPLPALQLQPVQQPDVIGQYTRLLQLKQAMQNQPLQQQLLQQQVQSGQQQIQSGQQELDARKALNAAYAGAFTTDANGNQTIDPNKLAAGLKGTPAAYQTPAVLKNISDTLSSQVELKQKVAALQQTSQDMLGSAASAVKAAGYDPIVAHSLLDTLAQQNPQNPQMAQIRQSIDNPQALKQLVGTAIQNSPAQQKLQNAKDVASIRSNNVDMQEMNDWMAKNPGKTQSDYQQFKVDQGVQASVAKETNPQVQAFRMQTASAEGAARANVEAQVARGSNAALATVPPHLVAPATEAATKAGTDYAQAQSVSQRLQEMMDAAKNGNVVSYQLIPQEGALQVTTSQGVHRINMAEIQNYGGGSLWQQLQGHLGKALTGASIPNSVLNDMSQMQDIQQRGAQSKYENTLKTINQYYGSSFKPVDISSTPSNSGGGQNQPGGAVSVGSVVMQNGHPYKVKAVDKNGKPTAADPVVK